MFARVKQPLVRATRSSTGAVVRQSASQSRTFSRHSRLLKQAAEGSAPKEAAAQANSGGGGGGGGLLPAIILVGGAVGIPSYLITTDDSAYNTVAEYAPGVADALKQPDLWNIVTSVQLPALGDKKEDGEDTDSSSSSSSSSSSNGSKAELEEASEKTDDDDAGDKAQSESNSNSNSNSTTTPSSSSTSSSSSTTAAATSAPVALDLGSKKDASPEKPSVVQTKEVELQNRGALTLAHKSDDPEMREQLIAQSQILKKEYETELERNSEYYQAQYNARVEQMQKEYAEKEAEMQARMKQFEEQVLKEQQQTIAANEQEKQEQLKAMEDKLEAGKQKLAKEYEVTKAELKRRYDTQLHTEREERVQAINNLRLRVAAINKIMDNQLVYEEQSQQVHRLWFATYQLARSIESDQPFMEPLNNLVTLGKGDEVIEACLDSIGSLMASTGVSTLRDLTERYSTVSQEVRRAMYLPKRAKGFLWRSYSIAMENITYHETGLVPGNHPEAILARAEFHLKHGNLKKAVQEMDTLPDMYADVTEDWLNTAKRRLVLEQTLDLLNSHLATRAFTLSA